MKIYNKREFSCGLGSLLICIFGFIAMILKGFSVKLTITCVLMLLIAVMQFSLSFSKKAFKEAAIENDERDQYILLKTAHKSSQIIDTFSFLALIALMVLYGVTKNEIALGAFLLSAVYITLSFIVRLASNIYYEKHE